MRSIVFADVCMVEDVRQIIPSRRLAPATSHMAGMKTFDNDTAMPHIDRVENYELILGPEASESARFLELSGMDIRSKVERLINRSAYLLKNYEQIRNEVLVMYDDEAYLAEIREIDALFENPSH